MKHSLNAIPIAVVAMALSLPAGAVLEPVTQTYTTSTTGVTSVSTAVWSKARVSQV